MFHKNNLSALKSLNYIINNWIRQLMIVYIKKHLCYAQEAQLKYIKLWWLL